MNFLQDCANQIIANNYQNLKICLICPNIRTIDYLKYHLSANLNRSIRAPKFLNLSEFTSGFSDIQKADELFLMIQLYKSFKTVFNNSNFFTNYDFDKFYGIGEIILKDFNEIDNYLLDVEQIFVNIKDYESINYIEDYLNDEQIEAIREFFSYFSVENISEEKQYFAELWSNLPELYKNFTKVLNNHKIGYNGLINRDLCNKIDNNLISFDTYEKYIFIGFNALTKSQKKIMQAVQKTGKALFFWDYDNFYTKDIENEAGLFVRENLKLFSDDLKTDRDRFLKDKKIKLIGFPLEIAQTKAMPQILCGFNINFDNKKQLAQTAVVMPDENLLFPLLHALPTEIKHVNLTLGFPFRNTAVYVFMMQWYNILSKFIKKNIVHIDEILSFFKNQIFIDVIADRLDFITNSVKKSNKIYFSIKDLEDTNDAFLKVLFSQNNIDAIENLLDNSIKVLEILFKPLSKEDRKIETEAIYQFYRQMSDLQSQFLNEFEKDKEIISVKILLKFLIKLISGAHIPFQGKNIDGLQVMTIMETRNLDFENVVILNLNEQILPKKASNNSLISEFIRKSYGLPVLMYQDSIFAFLFYSLIQNAKNIVLTYSNLISEKGGEPSRFIQQLKFETDLISQEYYYAEQIKPKRSKKIIVEKNEKICSVLQKYLTSEKMLSASALNTYLTCPLKFYFQRVAQILPFEEQKQEFEIDAQKFGNIFHKTMEKIYKPFIKKEVHKEDLNNIKKNIATIVNQTILEELENIEQAALEGLNKIISDVIKKYVERFIDNDISYAPFYIKSLENSEKYYRKFNFELNGEQQNITLYGIIDRIDTKDNLTRIIDYKTGGDDLSVSSIENLFDSDKVKNTKKAIFQMLLYTLIYKKNYQTDYFEIILMKTVNEKMDNESNIKIGRETLHSNSDGILSSFEEKLINLLKNLFNEKRPFYQTSNLESCSYCDYKGICGR